MVSILASIVVFNYFCNTRETNCTLDNISLILSMSSMDIRYIRPRLMNGKLVNTYILFN